MTLDFSAVAGLHAICALAYGFLAALIFVRQFGSSPDGTGRGHTGLWLAAACLSTAIWAGSVAVFWDSRFMAVPAWLELAHAAAWYGFILHLYRQTVTAPRQMRQAFTTMGLLAVLLVGGLPHWGYSKQWGYGPSGGIGLVLLILIILLVLNVIPRGF